MTQLEGLVLVDFQVRSEPDDDGFYGTGLLLRDPEHCFHGVFCWVYGNVPGVLIELAAFGVEYRVSDVYEGFYVLQKTGPERVYIKREYVRPRAHGDWIPVVKRIEFGKSKPDFPSYSIPDRTTS